MGMVGQIMSLIGSIATSRACERNATLHMIFASIPQRRRRLAVAVSGKVMLSPSCELLHVLSPSQIVLYSNLLIRHAYIGGDSSRKSCGIYLPGLRTFWHCQSFVVHVCKD